MDLHPARRLHQIFHLPPLHLDYLPLIQPFTYRVRISRVLNIDGQHRWRTQEYDHTLGGFFPPSKATFT